MSKRLSPVKIGILAILINIISISFVTFSFAYVYDVIGLGNFGGFLGGTPVQGFASAINNSGQIVGTNYDLNGNARPFFWENGTIRDIGTLGGSSGQAVDINNSGQVVGWAADTTGSPRAFMWQTGTINSLGASAGTESYARAINDSGNIVGNVYYDYGRAGIDVFLWSNGQVSNLGSGWANAINNSNQILISSSYFWDNGTQNPISISGRINTTDSSMNNLGQVALQVNDRAVIWNNGITIDIGTLGGNWSEPASINNQGIVVGRSNYSINGNDRAFIFKDGIIYDLNSLISESSGWTIIAAMDINDLGQIAAYARSADGAYGGVLLNPVPIPSAAYLLLSGMVGIFGVRKYRKM